MSKGTDKSDVMRRQRCSLTVTKVKTASTDDKTASMDNKTVPPDDKTEAMFGSTPQIIFRLNNLVVPKYVITFAWSNKIATLTEDMSKKSIRFFNDREVRAVWDEEHNKWWFSAPDGKQRKADACNHGDRLLIFRGIKNLSL